MYFLILFIFSNLWMFFYRPKSPGVPGYLSFILQQLFIFLFFNFLVITVNSGVFDFVIGGISFFYTFFILFDSLIYSITSMSLGRSLKVLSLGGDFLMSLEEVGFSTGLIIILFLISVVLFLTGGFFEHKISIYYPYYLNSIIQLTLLIFALCLFIIEQYLSKEKRNYMLRDELPVYAKIFKENKSTVKVTIPHQPDSNDIAEVLNKIKPLKNPENIIYILLESFRHDMIDEKTMPNLTELSRSSLLFKNAFADSIYTNLTWNTLFFDRPAYTFADDVKKYKKKVNPSGALPFNILKKAGYTNYISTSANLKWKSFYDRITGDGNTIDFFYSGSNENSDNRNIIDNRSTGKVISWIKNQNPADPFCILLQLDSTHWTYYFDKENEIATPYCSDVVNIAKLTNEKNIKLLFNRYRNAVNHVDKNIGQIINTLKENDLFENTIIVVVSDHGEGFKPGMIGHSVLHDDIKRIPLVLRLPSVKPGVVENPVQHKNILPTIFDYLKIKSIDSKYLYGSSVLNHKKKNDKPLLCFHGSNDLADLIFPEYTIRLKTEIKSNEGIFTPLQILKNNKPVNDDLYKKYLLTWQEPLYNIITNFN